MSPRDRDKETGKYSQQYDNWQFLGGIEELDTPTTVAIAEYVGCSYDLAYRRLQELEADGFIEKVDVGGSFLWQRPD